LQSSRYRAQMGTNGQMATNGQGEGLQMGNARSYRWVRRGAPQGFNWARGYIVSDLGVLPFLPLFGSLALLGGRRRSLRLLTPLALPDHCCACTAMSGRRERCFFSGVAFCLFWLCLVSFSPLQKAPEATNKHARTESGRTRKEKTLEVFRLCATRSTVLRTELGCHHPA